jgi:hypothetical protein
LFSICSDPDLLVSRAYEEDGWHIFFIRNFGELEFAQWERLVEELEDLEPMEEPDGVS